MAGAHPAPVLAPGDPVMALWCTLANGLWRAAGAPAARALARALEDPAEVQWRLLRSTVRRNRDTAYGRLHDFRSIRSVADFQARVPLVGYDDLDPFVERIRRGERRVLTAEPVLRLVPSSGSTAARKLVPWTATLGAEFGRALRAWTSDLLGSRPALRGGPAYWSVSPAVDGAEASEAGAVPVGFDEDTAYLGGPLAWLVRPLLAVPETLRHTRDVETFRYLTALGLLRAGELRLVSVWHPSFLALLLDAVERHFPALVRDVARGTVTPPGPVPDALAAALRPWRVADPVRARLLQAGPAAAAGLWPRLALVSCWADGSAGGPAETLRRRLPGVEIQPKGLLATEGVVTVPFGGVRPLAVCSHFFEFLDGRGASRTASELREGEHYSVVLTTGGGLYRYRLHDGVQVEGFAGRTPCLRFVGKEDRVSDLRGEKLDAGMVARVLERLLAGHRPAFAMLAPEERGAAVRYTLFVESEGPLPPGLTAALDQALSANPHYGICRRLGQLDAPALFRIARDAHAAYLDAEQARGRRLGDVKPAALSTLTDWADHFEGERMESAAGGREPLAHGLRHD
jgi:hypothetical protein